MRPRERKIASIRGKICALVWEQIFPLIVANGAKIGGNKKVRNYLTEEGDVKKFPNHFEMIGELKLYREIDDIDEKSTIFLIENTTLFIKNRRSVEKKSAIITKSTFYRKIDALPKNRRFIEKSTLIADYSPRKSSCALPKVRIGDPR